MREWKLKRGNMRRYNLTAHLYNSRYSEEQGQKFDKIFNVLELKGKCSILDVGCGTGLLFPYLKDNTHFIVGLDLSKNMLEKAKNSMRYRRTIHLILADVDNIPLRDTSFDTVFAITLLQNMPEGNQTLQETKRVMSKNAKLVVTGLTRHFKREEFLKLLGRAGFRCKTVGSESGCKFHMTICEK